MFGSGSRSLGVPPCDTPASSRIIVATVKYEGFLEESSRTSPAAACIDAVEPASR